MPDDGILGKFSGFNRPGNFSSKPAIYIRVGKPEEELVTCFFLDESFVLNTKIVFTKLDFEF